MERVYNLNDLNELIGEFKIHPKELFYNYGCSEEDIRNTLYKLNNENKDFDLEKLFNIQDERYFLVNLNDVLDGEFLTYFDIKMDKLQSLKVKYKELFKSLENWYNSVIYISENYPEFELDFDEEILLNSFCNRLKEVINELNENKGE